MKAEIISSGTELLLGEVIDTNSPYLARELAKIGVSVYHHTIVGDNPERLLAAIQQAESRADLVLISGGLGPTQDDITKDILANHLNLGLVMDGPSLKKIKARYHNEKVSLANQHQSKVIEGSIVLNNDIGMAAGMFVEKNDQQYVLLPGPPSEFQQMVTHHLIPLLKEKSVDELKFESRNLNFYGLAEATISEKLADLIEQQTNPTIALYAKEGIIDIRLTVSGTKDQENKELLDQVEAEIMTRIGEYFVSYNKKTMEDVIKEELESLQASLSIIEIDVNSELLANKNGENQTHHPLKASLYFSSLKDAQKCFEINKSEINESTPMGDNNELAVILKEKLKTDYALAISAEGEIQGQNGRFPKSLYLTIIDRKNQKLSKKVDFDRRMYLADWVIHLKISDFLRRYLLKKEQLTN